MSSGDPGAGLSGSLLDFRASLGLLRRESEERKQETLSQESTSGTTSTCTSSSTETSDSEEDCQVRLLDDTPEEALVKYVGTSNLVDLFETLLDTYLHDDEMDGKEEDLAVRLANKFGMKLPIQNQIETVKQTNYQLRQQVMRLQNENKELKSRLDCFQDPAFKLETLKANLYFENYSLVPVSINRRKHRTDPVTPVPSSMSLAASPSPDTLRINTFVDTENSRMNTYIESNSNLEYVDYLAKLNSIEFIHCCAEFNNALYFVVADRQTKFISYLTLKTAEEVEIQLVTFLKPEHCQNVIIVDAKFSPNGSMLACLARCRKPGFESEGPAPSQLYFYDLASSSFLPDVLDNVEVYAFASNGGLVYAVPETSSKPALLNLHSFGIPEEDVVLASFEDFRGWAIAKLYVTSDNRNVVAVLTNSDDLSQILQVPLDQTVEDPGEVAPVVVVPPRSCSSFDFIHSEDSLWYFVTTSFAPTGRIFSVNITHAESSPWKYQTLVTSTASAVMEWAVCLLDKFVICYCESGLHSLVLVPHMLLGSGPNFDDEREIEKIPLQPGTISSYFFSEESSSLIFQFTSLLIPSQIYRLQLNVSPNSGQTRSKLELVHGTPIPDSHSLKLTQLSLGSDPSDLCQQAPNLILIQAESKSEKVSSSQPPPTCLLVPAPKEGSAEVVQFSPLYFAISQYFGGIVCLVRSHFEGESASDDIILAAEYLVSENFASPETMFLYGPELPSAYLAAVTLNRRPELFAGMVMKSGIGGTAYRPECVQGIPQCSDAKDYAVEVAKIMSRESVQSSGGGPPTSAVKLTPSLTNIIKKGDLELLSQYTKILTDLGYGSKDESDNLFLKVYDPEDVNSADFQVEQEADILAFIHRVINGSCET